MDDLLEKFIKQNKQAFDEVEPSQKIWNGIELGLIKKKKDWSLLWKIAAMLFLTSTIYLTVERQFSDHPMDTLAAERQEFFEVERYYITLISDTKSALSRINIEEKNADLMLEEQELDQLYQELKREYLEQYSDEILMDALVENLRFRIKILNNQLELLKELEKEDHDSDHIEI